MPRDGSGAYTLPVGNPVITGTLIESTWANSTLSDIAVQLNNVLTRDGVLGPISPFKLVDGAVATPGLAFNSEPGLGWFRAGSSQISVAAVNAVVEDSNYSTAANVYKVLYPRTEGEASFRIGRSPFGSANTTFLEVSHNATESRIESLVAGTGVMGPITHQATAHKFNLTNANVYGQFSRPFADSSRLTLNKNTAATSANEILGTRNGVSRWNMSLGDGLAESGSLDIGSNFALDRFSDAGAFIDRPLEIYRTDGTVIMRTSLLNVVSALSPFASGFSASSGFPGVNTPLTTIQGNFIYRAAGFIGAVGTGVAQFYGNLIFPNTASPGSVFLAGPAPISWNTYYTSGAIRVMNFFNSQVGASGFGEFIYSDLLYEPGVFSMFRVTVAAAQFAMSNNGQGSSSLGWVATSDRRVKKNLLVIDNALVKIQTLTGYTYDKLDSRDSNGVAPRKAGYIAQDVLSVLPEAVTAANDEMGTLSVDHNGLIGLLIEGVKELHARLDQLEA